MTYGQSGAQLPQLSPPPIWLPTSSREVGHQEICFSWDQIHSWKRLPRNLNGKTQDVFVVGPLIVLHTNLKHRK